MLGSCKLQNSVSLNVTDGTQPPHFTSITVTNRFGDVLPRSAVLQPNNTITVTASATDPLGLPLEYKFDMYRRCGQVGTLQDWSLSNAVNYTLTIEDATTW
jgi:hypothetical protein